jgi:hypothetical protein
MLHEVRRRMTCLVAVFSAVLFLIAGVTPLSAGDRDGKCAKRIARAEAQLHEAVEHHGEHSRQAEKKRDELHRAREACHDFHDRDFDRDRH